MADKTEAMENLFQAIDIITAERLSKLGYDKTIKATVIDDSKADFGEYIVSDGSSQFTAYSADSTYAKDINVYVIIPQSDFDNQKLIVGKCPNKGDAYYNYANPSEDFLDMTHNLITSVQQGQLLANHTETSIRLWSCDKVNYKGYNRLALKGNFKTWLASLGVVSGSYGLLLYVVSKEPRPEEDGQYYERTYKFDLTSTDMYGDPFNFETYYLQEKVFDISNLSEIISMELVLVQNADFKDADKQLVPHTDGQGNLLPYNIFVQNPYVSFGYDLSALDGDTVLLYTLDTTEYEAVYDVDSIKKTMNVRWVHQDENGAISAIDQTTELPEGASIKWYKYVLNREVSDKLAGALWQEIPEAENQFSYTFTPDILVPNEKFKVIIESPSRRYVSDTFTGFDDLSESDAIKLEDNSPPIDEKYKDKQDSDLLQMALISYYDNSQPTQQDIQEVLMNYRKNHPTKYPEARYNAVISALDELNRAQRNVNIYKSEIMTFENKSYDPVSAAIDLVSGLKILVDPANFNGTYLVYSDTGMITNPAEAIKKRILTATYESLITGEKLLDKAESIIWYIPLENTMICPPQLDIEYDKWDVCSQMSYDELIELGFNTAYGTYARIERAIPEIGEGGDPGDLITKQTEQVFRIKDYYTQTATNNTIYCKLIKNNRDYVAEATLTFGISGTNGTDATFLLQMFEVDADGHPTDMPATALTIGKTIAVIPKVYDYNNTDITDSYLSSHTVAYHWESPYTDPGTDVVHTESNNISFITTRAGTTIDKCRYYMLSAQIAWNIIKYQKDENGKVKIDEFGQPVIEDDNGDIETRSTRLKTFLPIPVRINDLYTQVVGPTQIIYDKMGTNATYYKEPFVLYKNGEPDYDVHWQSACKEYLQTGSQNLLAFYPTITEEGKLTPPDMYLADENPYAVEVIDNGSVVWTQPILIIQNRYSSAMLNAWDGEFIVDEENGTIMATMLGAGKKDDNNTFSGVLMGDVAAGAGFDSRNHSGIGLYGFNKGEQSFSFNIDGTAFIGKAGRGRINFNGNSGIIESGAYVKNSTGMQIDLDGTDSKSSSLFAYGAGGSFELNTTANTPLLQIKAGSGRDDKKLFYIGSSGGENRDFYLQSENYTSGVDGTKIDLKTGKLELYNKGTGDNASSYIRIDGGGNPFFQIHDGSSGKDIFYATHNAYRLESTNFVSGSRGVKIDLYNGSLEARSGIIGGWTINATTLTAESMTINSNGSIGGGTTYPWSITNEGVASFKYMTAANGGKIGPFTFDADSLYIGAKGLGSSTVYLGTAGVSVGGSAFTANSSNGDIHVAGNIYIGGQIIGNNWGVGGGGGSSPSGFGGGNIGGVSAGFGNINAAAGNFGPWYIDDSGIYSADEASRLNPNGTMKLTSNGGVLDITGNQFSYRSNDGPSISIYNDFVFIRGGEGAYIDLDSDHMGIKTTSGYININSQHVLIKNSGTTLEMLANGGLKIDNKTCKEDQKLNIGWLISGLKRNLYFHKGLLVNDDFPDDASNTPNEFKIDQDLTVDGSLTVNKEILGRDPDSKTVKNLGKLAFKNSVEVASANFSYGSGITINSSSVSGNTATYDLTIKGDDSSYSGYAGYSETIYIYADNNGNVTWNTYGYNPNPSTYSLRGTWTGGGQSYYSGTVQGSTKNATLTIKVTATT